ncbi:AAA family ATPase [Shewanella oncorhynchi]|uniref:AAA family ATPase n=1 Tax=Shewanella oncorhynchi TaxID=2726434 RepID=UPI003D796156
MEYIENGKSYYFADANRFEYSDDNHFTVIVGKNGTGKSRLLEAIISTLFEDKVPQEYFIRDYGSRFRKQLNSNLIVDREPKKVIAVSTSPFDRFPLIRHNYSMNRYKYLGLRGLPSRNLGLAYMARIMNSLIESIINDSERASIVADVLNYLGYSDSIEARFHLAPTVRGMEDILQSKNPEKALCDYFMKPTMGPYSSNSSVSMELTIENIQRALIAFSRVMNSTTKPRFDVEISRGGIQIVGGTYYIDEDFVFLVQSGIARLRDVTFIKNGMKERLRINDASSGEQSVVMSLLGIASQIEDNCLICIDEPEVCLHPEWQEKYIELLTSTFNMYKGCQFLIATHSPQIISNLDTENCYIMPMDTGIAVSAVDFVNKSADFQLVNVFKSPGFRNEYLSRIALNVFTKVSKRKKFDDIDLTYLSVLEGVFDLIDEEDPIHGLVIAIKEMYVEYA